MFGEHLRREDVRFGRPVKVCCGGGWQLGNVDEPAYGRTGRPAIQKVGPYVVGAVDVKARVVVRA